MAENLLNEILNGKIELEQLFTWLEKGEIELCLGGCSQGEFISHFLNFIHEEAPCFDKYSDTPHKVHTPKSIRKLEVQKTDPKVKRRSALFAEESDSSPNTSTPKCSRPTKSLLNEVNTDVSYTSPVSPIYTHLNSYTPRNRKPAPEKSLCLGDFMVVNKKSSRKKAQKPGCENVEPQEYKKLRRINPTNLNQRRFSKTTDFTNSFNFTNEEPEVKAEEADEHRNFLVAERQKVAIEPAKITKISTIKTRNEILPDLNLATYKNQIDCLVSVYSYFLNNNLVLNVTSEIYFVISLVLRKQFDDFDIENLSISDDSYVSYDKIFSTIHNTIYFAVQILEKDSKILSLLEKPCIKLLSSNERLLQLSPKLCADLIKICDKRAECLQEISTDSEHHVCFMSDTDNRENFQTDQSFHAFRKQRDLFYDIIRIWEEHHASEGWIFGMALGGKIKTLLSLHNDATNYRHLSRLFKSQLLKTCTKVNVDTIPENQLSFLTSIPNINSEKLSRLKNRLVTKTTSNGINALPTFTGQQEFYKDFILTASTHIFNTHLKDAFIYEIMQLNDSRFSCNELEEKDTSVDFITQKTYKACLKSLRLLAKFLGFIESLPYQKQCSNISDKVLTAELALRQSQLPIFDIKQILVSSIRNGTLILTIPWLTKYLSMLDNVTLRLKYYESLHDLLFEIFYNTKEGMNMMLVRLCLGWLFELPHFPSELYFIYCTKHRKYSQNVAKETLDNLDIVDRDVIYMCCPYLHEFKKLLQYNCAKNGTITVKHITPVTATESPTQVNEKRLKLQLEEAFLNAQPISMRKTVEFVSERVASACVKCICNKLVPEEKRIALIAFKKFLNSEIQIQDISTKKFKTELKFKCGEFVQDRLSKLQDQCTNEIEKQVSGKISNSIRLLLSEEELEQTVEACISITSRMCKDRVQQWVNAHIISGIYSKDFDNELVQILNDLPKKEVKIKSGYILPTLGRNMDHNPEADSAQKICDDIRELTIEILESSSDVNQERVGKLIINAEKSLAERCDINDTITLLINRLFLDLLILLIAHFTKICEKELIMKFVAFWKMRGDKHIFKSIICPRNVEIMNRSSCRLDSWDKLADFNYVLLRERLLDSDDFEEQCIAIYQQDWDSMTLRNFSSCFQKIVDNYSRYHKGESKFTYLLSFLSDFCSDMEFAF